MAKAPILKADIREEYLQSLSELTDANLQIVIESSNDTSNPNYAISIVNLEGEPVLYIQGQIIERATSDSDGL